MTTCRSCHAQIIWVVTEAGRKMPLDPEPTEAGKVIIRMGPHHEQAVAHVETAEETVARLKAAIPAARTAYIPHHASCPDAAKWRDRQKGLPL